MKKTNLIYLSISLIIILLISCNKAKDTSDVTLNQKIPVTVANITRGTITSYLELNGTSAFTSKSQAKANISGYITDIFVSPGSVVVKGQHLFTLKTKEAAAISNDTISQFKFSGLVQIKAGINGIITSVDRAVGDYVMEGDPLCQIAVPSSLIFYLDVPVELINFIKINGSCEVVLPNGNELKGIIKSRYPIISNSAQTVRYIVQISNTKDIPENLIAKIKILKNSINNAISLPKSCVLTNELMNSFWVMKLINDSTAVKVVITPGIDNGENIQILSPVFNNSDLFLSSGNYGIGDTVFIKVNK